MGKIRDLRLQVFQPTRPLRGATEQSSSSAEPSQFQPTRPLRGATESFCQNPWSEKFQPTRPLRGATSDTGAIGSKTTISTHAPLAGRDSRPGGSLLASIQFQPTRPLRGATTWPHRNYHRQMGFQPTRPLRGATRTSKTWKPATRISTHAPLAGRDSKRVQITMHIFAITDKFQMLLHRMPPVRAFCSFLMQENHADFGCEPPK